jgi:hypothetical protein
MIVFPEAAEEAVIPEDGDTEGHFLCQGINQRKRRLQHVVKN